MAEGRAMQDAFMDIGGRATQDAYMDIGGRATQEQLPSSCRDVPPFSITQVIENEEK